MTLDNKGILITGGTGSFGKQMVKTIFRHYKPRRVAIFSRDELKQFEMANNPDFSIHKEIRFFIGDVREEARLRTAMRGIDVVIHAAALKQVPSCEYNPFEAIKTNILGAQNVITASIACGVKKVIALSTDKAAAPINLYGATKLCSDKLFIASNSMAGDGGPVFSVVRYGNVVGSRGSVIPFFLRQARNHGELTVTDRKMTRFSITLQEGAEFVRRCFDRMQGGEIFIPKIPSYRITDVITAIAPDLPVRDIGIRPGEKLHEVMITADDARYSNDCGDHYLIRPAIDIWKPGRLYPGVPCAEGFVYSSEDNERFLTVDEIKELVKTEIYTEAR